MKTEKSVITHDNSYHIQAGMEMLADDMGHKCASGYWHKSFALDRMARFSVAVYNVYIQIGCSEAYAMNKSAQLLKSFSDGFGRCQIEKTAKKTKGLKPLRGEDFEVVLKSLKSALWDLGEKSAAGDDKENERQEVLSVVLSLVVQQHPYLPQQSIDAEIASANEWFVAGQEFAKRTR